MEQLHYKPVEGTPFRLEISSVQNRPGTWNSTKVSIYRDDDYDVKTNVYRKGILIGEYLRNYGSYAFESFHPFQIDEEWYALYSAEYTATRVMKLHEDRIEDWCGEESHANGFCPTEFYVPKFAQFRNKMEIQGKETEYDYYMVDGDCEKDDFMEGLLSPEFVKLEYCNFGFLCGCVWGDDTSWKLRYIDLSQIPNKILAITDKFGYWELPEGPLRSHIRMDGWEPGHDWVVLHKQEHINLKTDERC